MAEELKEGEGVGGPSIVVVAGEHDCRPGVAPNSRHERIECGPCHAAGFTATGARLSPLDVDCAGNMPVFVTRAVAARFDDANPGVVEAWCEPGGCDPFGSEAIRSGLLLGSAPDHRVRRRKTRSLPGLNPPMTSVDCQSPSFWSDSAARLEA